MKTDNFDTHDINENHTMAVVMAVFPFLFFLPLVSGKNSPYMKFMANQTLIYFILDLVLNAVCKVVGAVPFIGGLAAGILGAVINLVMLIFWLIGLINAINGNPVRYPLIGEFDILK